MFILGYTNTENVFYCLTTNLMRFIALTTWVREPNLLKPNSSRDREENTITLTRVSRADSGKKLTKDFTKSMTFRKFLRPTLLESSIRITRSTRDLQTNGKTFKELVQPNVRLQRCGKRFTESPAKFTLQVMLCYYHRFSNDRKAGLHMTWHFYWKISATTLAFTLQWTFLRTKKSQIKPFKK